MTETLSSETGGEEWGALVTMSVRVDSRKMRWLIPLSPLEGMSEDVGQGTRKSMYRRGLKGTRTL